MESKPSPGDGVNGVSVGRRVHGKDGSSQQSWDMSLWGMGYIWDISGIYLLDVQHPDRCLSGAEQGAPSEGESAPAGTGVSCCVTHSRFLPQGPKTDELIGGVCFRAV